MYFIALPLVAAALPAALARPASSVFGRDFNIDLTLPANVTACNISTATMSLPSGQTSLVEPSLSPTFIGLGIGVQNYTCSDATSTWTSVGAVAELVDISCLYGTSEFETSAQIALDVWQDAPSGISVSEIITILAVTPLQNASILGQHYFVPTPGNSSTLSAKWDFTSSGPLAGNPNAFVLGAKTGDIPAPANSSVNVDWLAEKGVEGDLASQIFRVVTAGGQPPSSCSPGAAPLSVKYAAQYWLFGGNATASNSSTSSTGSSQSNGAFSVSPSSIFSAQAMTFFAATSFLVMQLL